MDWKSAKAYVDTLSYAGGGWRLPTLQEAMSLLEPEKVKVEASEDDSLYIDASFKDTYFFFEYSVFVCQLNLETIY